MKQSKIIIPPIIKINRKSGATYTPNISTETLRRQTHRTPRTNEKRKTSIFCASNNVFCDLWVNITFFFRLLLLLFSLLPNVKLKPQTSTTPPTNQQQQMCTEIVTDWIVFLISLLVSSDATKWHGANIFVWILCKQFYLFVCFFRFCWS